MPHDGCYATRISQGSVYISRDGRAHSPQIIIRRALQQEVLQILNIATQACSSQHSHLTILGSAFNRTQLAKSVLSRYGRPTLATLFNLQIIEKVIEKGVGYRVTAHPNRCAMQHRVRKKSI
jgi:hypothetical protein